MASDLSADGTVGDASKATADKGKATGTQYAHGFIGLLKQVAETDISHFD